MKEPRFREEELEPAKLARGAGEPVPGQHPCEKFLGGAAGGFGIRIRRQYSAPTSRDEQCYPAGCLLGFGWIFCFRHVGILRQTDSEHNSRFKIRRGKMQNLVRRR
jgi:hypothetical protein